MSTAGANPGKGLNTDIDVASGTNTHANLSTDLIPFLALSPAAPSRPPSPEVVIGRGGLHDPGIQPYDPTAGDGNWKDGLWLEPWLEINGRLCENPDYVRFKEDGFGMSGYRRVRLALGSRRTGPRREAQHTPALVMLVRKDERVFREEEEEKEEEEEEEEEEAVDSPDNRGRLWKDAFVRMRAYLDAAGGSGFGLHMMDEGVFHEENIKALAKGMPWSARLVDAEAWAEFSCD